MIVVIVIVVVVVVVVVVVAAGKVHGGSSCALTHAPHHAIYPDHVMAIYKRQ